MPSLITLKNNRMHHYERHISKEQISALPLVSFEGEVHVVNTKEAVAPALEYLNRQKVVGVDTEARPSFQRGQHFPTALVQIATLKRCYLFQINKIGMTDELAAFFENEQIKKVGLAFRDDLGGLRSQHPFAPANCVDIQQIVNSYGIFDLGLQKVYAIVFGQRISKSQQLTNWDTPTLTLEQARYASTDAWATLRIYLRLTKRRPLPKAVVEKMRAEEKELMIRHQQEMMLQKKEEEQQTKNEPPSNL